MEASSRLPGTEPGNPRIVRVDMHLHTMWSGDATTTPEELTVAVAAAGLDVVCITDHGTTNGAVKLAESGELGCRIVVGEEVRTTAGEIIGLFLTERLPLGLTPRNAADAIHDQGGLVYIPHPFDPMRHCLREDALRALADDGLIDAMEAFNAKVSLSHLNRQAADFAVERDLAAGAGSDAHVPEAVGAAYVEMADFDDGDAAGFLAALRQGRIVGRYSDPARTWTPRVVPSTRAI